MLMSSLTPEELPVGTIGGGGVLMRSSKLFQKFTPPECLMAWFVNALEDRLLIESSLSDESSGIFSELSMGPAVTGPRFGEEAVVVGCDGCRLMSPSASLSRTCRMTSASRLTSVSIGAPSSKRAARIRFRFLDFGYGRD